MRPLIGRLAPLAIGVVLAACTGIEGVTTNGSSGSSTTVSSSAAITSSQGDTLAQVVALDLSAANEGVTSDGGSLAGIGISNNETASPTPGVAASSTPLPPLSFGRGNDVCSPAPDTTGVSSTVAGVKTYTKTWTYKQCAFSQLTPNIESTLRDGTIKVVRVTGAGNNARNMIYSGRPNGISVPANIPGFTKTWTRVQLPAVGSPAGTPTKTITTVENRNGGSSVSDNGTVLSKRDSANVTVFTHADGSVSTHSREWTTTFTADVAGSIQANKPLPAGTWTFPSTNASGWQKGGTSYSLATSTPTVNGVTGVHYNPSCTALPQFDKGTLKTVVTKTVNNVTKTTTVTITFSACGQFTATTS